MHNLGLGLACTVMSIVFQIASLLDVKKELSASIKKSMEDLVRARIDFAPLEILASYKTTGWIGSDYMRFAKFMCYILRYLDIYIFKKNHTNVNIKDFNSKMCKNYLLLRNLEVPNKIADKREAVFKHKQSMKNDSIDHNKLSAQPLICGLYKLIANIMTAVDSKKSKLQIHYKQYLNAFSKMDELIKTLSNDASDSNRCVSTYNNLNVGCIIRDIEFGGPIRFTWEGNWHGEKGIQPVKEQFVSQKGKFGEVMINKLYTNKVLEHLSPNASMESENVSQFNNYVIDSMVVLQNKLKRCVPIPFIKTKDGSLAFVIRNSAAIEFKFTDLIDVQMGLFYFKIALGGKYESFDAN